MRTLITCGCLIIVSTCISFAQDVNNEILELFQGKIVAVVTKDSTYIVGTLSKYKNEKIYVMDIDGEVKVIDFKNVKNIKLYRNSYSSEIDSLNKVKRVNTITSTPADSSIVTRFTKDTTAYFPFKNYMFTFSLGYPLPEGHFLI